VIKALEPKFNPEEIVERLQGSRVLTTVIRGLVWLDQGKQAYRVDTVGRILLETPAKTGPLADLAALFESELAASTGPQATRAIAFATPAGRYIRMRWLCTSEDEQLYLVEDVTDLVVTDIELQDNKKAFTELFENSTHGIFRANLEGDHIHANPALTSMMGCASLEQWIALSAGGIGKLYVKPERFSEFFQTLQSYGKVIDHVSEVRRADGHALWISISAWRVFGSDGKPLCYDGTFTDVTERMQRFVALQKIAETDELTGLSNRAKLYEVIENRTSQPGESLALAVMLIDLDRFKDINDVFGHATGDEVLLEVSRRLRAVIGTRGLAARLGGDEFAVVVEVDQGGPTAESIGQQLVAAMREVFNVNGIDHALSASVGIACYPEDAVSRGELLRKADIALYHVKTNGRNNLCLFAPVLEVSRQRSHYLAQELRDADKRGELELHYQPIVESATGRTMGLEALMRWHHPQRGTVSPAEFIPIAEDAGYMPVFGAWAIREACSHVASLPKHLFVSVNVSAVQFNAADFPDIVSRTLRDTGLDPCRLELEVTEGIVLRNEARTIEILDRLKEIGVTIALDDFGTGYSSFGYLQKFPFDKVKIDRSFVKNLSQNKTNAALVRAVLSIGRDLGLPVVAEGVENTEQRDLLAEQGCPLFQGYLFGKPQRFADVANNLALESLNMPSGNEQTELDRQSA
jgi:diguanylate cyclase (GGDEF)-like protein/PAS domain S-box-containing protein